MLGMTIAEKLSKSAYLVKRGIVPHHSMLLSLMKAHDAWSKEKIKKNPPSAKHIMALLMTNIKSVLKIITDALKVGFEGL